MTRPGALAAAIVAAICCGYLAAGCAAADTRDEEAWSDTGGADDAAEFDQQLREKHLQEQEYQARIAALAEEHKRKQKAPADSPSGGQSAPVAPTALCQPPYDEGYKCTCQGPQAPAWAGQAKAPASRDGQGHLRAVARIEGMKSLDLAIARAHDRAAMKILASLKGAAVDENGLPKEKIDGRLVGVESLGVWAPDPGNVLAMVRVRTDAWKPDPAVLEASCPEPKKANYRCACAAGQTPDWLQREAWHGEDGYIYASGYSPDAGDHTASRAQARAFRSLGRFLSGFQLQGQPIQPSGGIIRATSVSELRADKVQQVTTHPLPQQGLATLVRYWVGL